MICFLKVHSACDTENRLRGWGKNESRASSQEAIAIRCTRDDDSLDHSGISAGGERCSDSGYILKVEFTGLAN